MSLVRTLLATSLALCVLVTGHQTSNAQATKERVQIRQGAKYGSYGGIRRVSLLIGAPVSLQGNVAVGKIEDFVINENGCIDYLTVIVEDKYILVPWTAAQVDFERRGVLLGIERERFREIPTFTRDHWPNL